MSMNNCFVLGAKAKNQNGKIIKVPVFIDTKGRICKLFGGKNGNLYKKYELSYEDANRAMQNYLHSKTEGAALKVCV